MARDRKQRAFSPFQMFFVVLLRVAIGWHLLYEGLVKLVTPDWTAAGYLRSADGFLADYFHQIVDNPLALGTVDLLNIWGLILIGLALILGCLTRFASLCGMALVLLYYLAHPPLPGLESGMVAEGSYLYVDKNLVELIALAVLLVIPSGKFLGLDRIITYWLHQKTAKAPVPAATGTGAVQEAPPPSTGRRQVLAGLATLPFAVAFAGALLRKHALASHEEKNLVDAMTSATIKKFEFTSLADLKGEIPTAKIREVPFSRVILGGNLIGGWAHARDLIYVSKLVKAYHHQDKIFETFALAEKCGINTILTNPILCEVINNYWKSGIGKIQFVSDCGGADLLKSTQLSIDNGATACYVQGATADNLVKRGKFDLIAQALDLIRANNLPAGIGGHYIETIQACVEKGLEPDFWMKTLHPLRYWSAEHPREHDNVFCRKPEETVAYMESLKQPWIAFKILGAGALHPNKAFRYAFESGADFICVGMYDFQIVDDVNIALDALNSDLTKRARAWMA